MLKAERSEYQYAAAMVLGELKVKDFYVVKALGEVLTNGENRTLKGYILDAFEKIKSKESLQFLLPLLFASQATEAEFSERAITIASSLGSESARELKSMLKKTSAQERCIINSIFIKMRSLEGLKVILDSLQNEDTEVVDEICTLMKEETKALSSAEKKNFSSKVETFLKNKKPVKSRQTLCAAIKILGYLGMPGSQSTLMAFTTLQNHPYIRSQALMALKDIQLQPNTRLEVIKKLMSYLDEQDFTSIVSPTMDILMRIPFQTRMVDLVIKLLKNQHSSVRQFAIKKMRELNSPRVVRVLIENLAAPESVIRDLAAESLCWLDSARTVLLEKIIEEEDLDLSCLYAKILKPHAPKLRSNQIKQLYNHLSTLMDKDSRLQEPLIFLIKTAAPDFLHESLIARAKTLKKKKKFDEVVKTLKLLQMNGRLDQEATFELAVCQLKQIPKNQKAQPADSDPSLYLLHQLSKDPDFPLTERIKSEKVIEGDEIFYIASFFMKKLKQERIMGSALLEMLAQKHPRSKAGIASRKLLKSAEL